MVIETNISMSPRKSCSQSVQNSLYDMLKKFTNIRSSTDINWRVLTKTYVIAAISRTNLWIFEAQFLS